MEGGLTKDRQKKREKWGRVRERCDQLFIVMLQRKNTLVPISHISDYAHSK